MLSIFRKSYELITPPALPVGWDEYSARVERKLHGLLDESECEERVYQQLFVHHPCLLPWMYGTFGGGHHGLIHGSVISQPRLTGLVQARQPDFLMISRDTSSVFAILFEIESPGKRWFTQAGQPTAQLTQAINQLRQWKDWFEQPGNNERFLREFRVPEHFGSRRFEQRYFLIFGRRKELQDSGLARQRSQHQKHDEHFLSYDHLAANPELRDAVTVNVDAQGYRAVAVQPTIRLGPMQASDHCMVRDKENAVDASDIPSGRAKFLKERWSYWDRWATSSGSRFASTQDWE